MPNDLLAMIRDKQSRIAKLQSELDEAKRLLVGGVKEGQSVATDNASQRKPTNRSTTRTHKKKQQLPTGPVGQRPIPETSSVGRTIVVLREHGEPLTVPAIIERIQERFHQRVLKETLVGNLSRYVTAGKVFYRPEPSTYGLAEWKGKQGKAS
jgi:hypothetical protein